MKTIAMIRCVDVGVQELALRDRLAGHFGDDVWFVADNTSGKATWPAEIAGRVIEMTKPRLRGLGLRTFPKSGWQCGDHCYYVADATIPDWDFAWLIENDVGFGFADVGDFFRQFEGNATDYLAVGLGKRHAGWKWHATMAEALGPRNIHGGPFPLTRLSRRAAHHLAQARAALYASLDPRIPRNQIPNDEVFVASRIANDGFTWADLKADLPADTFAMFTTTIPVMPEELAHAANAGRVMHPVRPVGTMGGKLERLGMKGYIRLRDRVVSTVGPELWSAWTGLAPDAPHPAGDGAVAEREAEAKVRRRGRLREAGYLPQGR